MKCIVEPGPVLYEMWKDSFESCWLFDGKALFLASFLPFSASVAVSGCPRANILLAILPLMLQPLSPSIDSF